ncbi:hypothetical protein LCGC14_1128200 [marine sediment metagenome]|uniref:VWA domain-containing protein n=1 Tax=marine sediment metagenome TaxID=412755 RepID=A0A0F9M6N1_9ZZZZ
MAAGHKKMIPHFFGMTYKLTDTFIKKKLLLFILLFFFMNLCINPAQEQKRLQEEVIVIAVEVPVRVIHKGKVVKNLTKEDFEIYEKGIKQKITAFEVISRKISISKKLSPEDRKIAPKKRLFILIFNIFDYTDAVGEAIDYFFKNVFTSGDRLIILTEDKLFNIEIEKGLPEMIFNLKETLKKYKLISNKNTLRAYRDLKHEGDRVLNAFEGATGDVNRAIINFLETYLRIWADYRRQYFTPDLDLYRSIIKRVKQIEGEKWAICFQQRKMFPGLKNKGRLGSIIDYYADESATTGLHIISSKHWELQRSLNISYNFPTKILKNLFMEANITFHLILMKSLRDILYRDFELREVAQDYEDCFKQISFSTGGYVTFSNKVTEALKEATEAEDYYYLLVYSPDEDPSEKKRKIKVKVKKRGSKVIHLKHIFEKEAVPISIIDFKAGHKTMKFSLSNYQMIKIKGKLTGIAEVKITLFDKDSEKVFDERKTLNLLKKEATISLNFNQLKSGNYFIIIQVIDKISNAIDVFSRQIEL